MFRAFRSCLSLLHLIVILILESMSSLVRVKQERTYRSNTPDSTRRACGSARWKLNSLANQFKRFNRKEPSRIIPSSFLRVLPNAAKHNNTTAVVVKEEKNWIWTIGWLPFPLAILGIESITCSYCFLLATKPSSQMDIKLFSDLLGFPSVWSSHQCRVSLTVLKECPNMCWCLLGHHIKEKINWRLI